MTTVHTGILRARAEALVDVEERDRLVKLIDDLESLERILGWSVKRPKTLANYGITKEHVERAQWTRDRLDEEIAGRLARSEKGSAT